MNNSVSQITIQDCQIEMNHVDISKSEKVRDFLQKLNQALKNNPSLEKFTIRKINESINSIEKYHLEKDKFYSLLSHIPQTEIYELSKLVAEVKKQINQFYDFISASDKLINLIEEACEHSHNKKFTLKNRTLLYYPLHSDEQGILGTSFTSFLESRGSLLVPFMVEFDKAAKRVRIMKEEEAVDWFEAATKYDLSPNSEYIEKFYKNLPGIFQLIKDY